MFSIRKSSQYSPKKTDKIEKRVPKKSRKRIVNYKKERALKSGNFTGEQNEHDEQDEHYEHDDYSSEIYHNESKVAFYIRANKQRSIISELEKGYNPDSSFGQNCPCCPYEEPDDLTNCFWEGNLEAFKVLLPRTDPEKILGERGVKIWGKSRYRRTMGRRRNCSHGDSLPFLKIMSEHFDIPSSYLYEYIGYDYSFDVDVLRESLRAIGKTEDSLDIKDIRLSKQNQYFYENLLNVTNLEWVLTYVFGQEMYNMSDRDSLIHIGQTCIRLGADTSKEMEFGLGYVALARKLSIEMVEGPTPYREVMKISLDELMVHVNNYLSEDHEVPEDYYHSNIIKTMEFLKEVYTGGKYEHAQTIQCFYRVFRSVKIVKDLRSLPENLFDAEFSTRRKKLMNVDDSRFNL